MKDFLVKRLISDNIKSELKKIGFDNSYIDKASDKYKFLNLKLYNLTPTQVNIIKQTALSVGADCAAHREVITGKIEQSDAILGGSYAQLKNVANKLETQPFSLGKLGKNIVAELEKSFGKTKLAGIVNVTPDSFSDGGKYYKAEDAINHIKNLIDDGADIIDIGAESTRPFSCAVSAEEQIKRLDPVLKKLNNISVPISVDTRSSIVAEFALQNGATIINDVSGMDFDNNMAKIIFKYKATVILQHSQGNPETMQINPTYKDVIDEIYQNLYKKINFAKNKGIENIIIDPGIGFGKSKNDNFEILNRIEEFYSLNLPVMVGVSRKSFLGVQDTENNTLKDELTLAVSYPLILKNVDYLRVHNVKLHRQLLDLAN